MALLCGIVAACAESKVALVIGNSRYVSQGMALANPANDAKDIAATLKTLGFNVTLITDAGQRDFLDALSKFSRAANDSDIALFYFAGHGVQYQGENYFLAVDNVPQDNADIEFKAIPMNRVVRATSRAQKTKIVILDACRNSVPDPGKSKASRSASGIGDASGLAPVNGSDGMIVFYSAEHSKEALDAADNADNSPFAQSLIKRIAEPGVDIKDVFTEVTSDVLDTTKQQQHPEIVTAELTSRVVLNPAETDQDVWKRIHNSNDPEVYSAFIKQFPNSDFVEVATIKRENLLSKQKALSNEAAKEQAKIEAAKNEAEWAARERAGEAVAEAERREIEVARAALDDRARSEWAAREMAAERVSALEEKQRIALEDAERERIRLLKEKEDIARRADEACQRDQAELSRLRNGEQSADLQALSARSTCPAVVAAAQQAIKEIAGRIADQANKDRMANAQAEAEKARLREFTAKFIAGICRRDLAELAKYREAKESDQVEALRARSSCPEMSAAADDAIRAIASANVQSDSGVTTPNAPAADQAATDKAASDKAAADALAAQMASADKARKAADAQKLADAAALDRATAEWAAKQRAGEALAAAEEAQRVELEAALQACASDQTDLVRFKNAKQVSEIQALRAKSTCRELPAAADLALKDLAVEQAKFCAGQQKELAGVDPHDLAALKTELDKLTCEDSRKVASQRIDVLMAEAARIQKICDDAQDKFTKIDLFIQSASTDLNALLAKSMSCPAVGEEISKARLDIKDRLSRVQTELNRLECLTAKPSGLFDQATLDGLANYHKARKESPDSPRVNEDLIVELQGQTPPVCLKDTQPPPPQARITFPPVGVTKSTASPSTNANRAGPKPDRRREEPTVQQVKVVPQKPASPVVSSQAAPKSSAPAAAVPNVIINSY